MSSRLRALAGEDDRYNLLEEWGLHDDQHPASGTKISRGELDVIIDFSTEQGAQKSLELTRETGCALLVGTTGLSRGILDDIEDSAESSPVMIAPNTSLGAVTLIHLAALAAEVLGSRSDVTILERHHRSKRDMPSGTALRLLEKIRARTGLNFSPQDVLSVRAGDLAGEHEIEFSGPGERLKIFHSVANRDVFVRGALEAAAWLCEQESGLYTIEQFLGIE